MPETWRSITLRQLLTHTAGLAHRFERTVDGTLLMDYTTEQMLRSARETPMQSEPGIDWSYSDQGYFLLGLIVEPVTGRSYEAFLRDRFFAPLGMDDTRLLDQAAIVPRRVAGYTIEGGELQNIRRDWQFGLASHFGVTSTIADLIRWERALVHRTVLPDSVLDRVFSPQYVFREVPAERSVLGYGFGWWVNQVRGRRFVEHSGITGTSYFRDLETGLTVLVLTNLDQSSGPGTMGIAHGVARIVDPTVETDVWQNDS